jgi:hypothetical protein
MTGYATHDPSFSDTTAEEWDAPQLNDFDTDDLSEVGEHFLLSATGFPPDDFTDLKLPVVDTEDRLNRRALRTAQSGSHGVGAVDGLDDDTRSDVEDRIDRLANDHFEDANFGDDR